MENQFNPQRLIAARERLGITKAEASRRLNLSKIGYSRYEYGDRTPSPQTLEVIAQCFDTSVDYLTGKTDDMSKDYILVNKVDNPLLFEIISSLAKSDKSSQEKILSYAKKLKNK